MAKKYSSKERKAYHMGRAWAAGKLGKRIPCPDEKTKQSFRNGVNDTRRRKTGGEKSVQAACNNCGAPLSLVDGNGVVLGIITGGAVK